MPHTLQIRLFGKFSASCGGADLDHIEAPRVQELCAYLLMYRDRPHPREALAGLLWGECSTAQSRKYLRQAIWHLQIGLDPWVQQSSRELLLVDADWIRLNPEASLWVDVAAFEKNVYRMRGVSPQSLDDEDAESLRSAVELYTSDLLECCYQEWCLYERERLQSMYLAALDKLMGYCEAKQQYEAGLGYGADILRYDQAQERTHRRLMRLHYLSGDRTAALRQFERCAAILQEELRVEPARSTMTLYEQIRADRLDEPTPEAPRLQQAHTELPATSPELISHLQQMRTTLVEIEHRVQEDIRAVSQVLRDVE